MAHSKRRVIARVTAIRPPLTPTYALAETCQQMHADRRTLEEAITIFAGAYAATAVWRAHANRRAAATLLDIDETHLHPKGARQS